MNAFGSKTVGAVIVTEDEAATYRTEVAGGFCTSKLRFFDLWFRNKCRKRKVNVDFRRDEEEESISLSNGVNFGQ